MTERNSDDKQIKVTDKRMFTADGELREEYQSLGDLEASDPGSSPAEPSASPSSAGTSSVTPSPTSTVGNAPGAPTATAPATGPQAPGSPISGAPRQQATPPEAADYPSGAQFEDLVALLAQTTVTFLQQSSRPEGRSESLEQAQLYLDLLGILDDKTHGNLAPGEKAMLQDALRQLRLAFAQRA